MSGACEQLSAKEKLLSQRGDRSGLSAEDEIIYKLRFNVPVSFFFFLAAATSPPSVTVI